MAHALRIGIKLSQDAPIETYRTIWRLADEAGFDHCWAMATIGSIGDDRPIFDSWELLAAMSTATRRVRMGLLVTGITYRNPALLAKIATTVDHLSGSRRYVTRSYLAASPAVGDRTVPRRVSF